jgi:hypothetical protein
MGFKGRYYKCVTVKIAVGSIDVASKYVKKIQGLSPQANYTDRATAACRRSSCQLLRMKVPRGKRDGSRRPYSRISNQEPLLFYQVAP